MVLFALISLKDVILRYDYHWRRLERKYGRDEIMQTNERRVPPPPPPNTQLLVYNNDGRATTTSLIIAEGTQVQHKNIIGLTRTYLSDLEEFGPLAFETRMGLPLPQGGFAKSTEFAHFNERQATLLMTYMKNTPIIREFKKQLVRAFYQLAEQPMSKAQHILAMAQKMVDHEARINHHEKRINHVVIEQSQIAIKQENQQQQIDCVSQRQDAMDSDCRTTPDTGYRAVVGFLSMKGLTAPPTFAKKLGVLTSKICRSRGIEIGKVPHEHYNTVNSYPIAILEECFNSMTKT